jgi:hypothetical protein
MFAELDEDDSAHDRPLRTAIVVAQDTLTPGNGFFEMYVKLRDPKARVRSQADRLAVHLRELGELDRHYRGAR